MVQAAETPTQRVRLRRRRVRLGVVSDTHGTVDARLANLVDVHARVVLQLKELRENVLHQRAAIQVDGVRHDSRVHHIEEAGAIADDEAVVQPLAAFPAFRNHDAIVVGERDRDGEVFWRLCGGGTRAERDHHQEK